MNIYKWEVDISLSWDGGISGDIVFLRTVRSGDACQSTMLSRLRTKSDFGHGNV